MMQQQTRFYQNSRTNLGSNLIEKPFATLGAKPTCYFNNQKQIFIPLANHSISIADIQKLQFSTFGEGLHEKRINCIKQKNNIIITGSNDFTIKLWDRLSGKSIHKFLKPGSQFNCLDLSQHILTAAHTSKLVFWDLRKMKQRSQFNESFNGQITTVQFDSNIPTIMMGCSVDGMINKFDLKQPNQQQAFVWCTKILQSPSKLQFINNIALVQTTNHILYLLEQQAVKNKIVVNNFEEPKHILNSKLLHQNNDYQIQYFSWNLQKQIVEKYHNQKVVGYVSNVIDSQIFIPLNKKTVLYASQNGQVFVKNFSKTLDQKNSQNNFAKQTNQMYLKGKEEKWQKIEEQEPSNKNGFILKKPSSFKQKTKKFKPF